MLLLVVPLAACPADEPLPLPSPVPDGPNMSGQAQRRMANCPSTVPGAVTKLELTPGGVDVTITAPGQHAQRRIVELAEFHERMTTTIWPVPHAGLRGGGARIGYCPILHHGARLTTTAVPGGVRVHLRADSPARVKELQETVSARAARLRGFASS
jgi:hypothetical protein